MSLTASWNFMRPERRCGMRRLIAYVIRDLQDQCLCLLVI